MVRARKLGKRFGEKRVLRGLDFDVDRGDVAVVTGPNGSGKTTLLRICAGLWLAERGGDRDRRAARGRSDTSRTSRSSTAS